MRFGRHIIIAGLLAVIAGAAGGLASEQFLWRPLRARKVSTISALVVVLPTAEAIEQLKQESEKTNAILHVTC